jgi:hypothetical protein
LTGNLKVVFSIGVSDEYFLHALTHISSLGIGVLSVLTQLVSVADLQSVSACFIGPH